MRLHILSDLHQEFSVVDIPTVDCDCVILAGDVATKLNGLKWIRRRLPDIPVIYLAGNHEYYGAAYPELLTQLRMETKGSNIIFLENDSVSLGGFHFFGATLWTDLELFGPNWLDASDLLEARLNDYHSIKNSRENHRRLSPRDTRRAHLETVEAMRGFFRTHDPARSAIITHHAPSLRSSAERFQGDLMTSGFASNLEGLIREHQPLLWVHGHMHDSSDYHIGRTRVLANPRGYPHAPNPGFIPDLVVELKAPLTNLDLDASEQMPFTGASLEACPRAEFTPQQACEEAQKRNYPGWSSLIAEIFQHYPEATDITIFEQLGGLRFTPPGQAPSPLPTFDLDAFAADILLRSRETCQICGAPGELRTIGTWRPLCDTHTPPDVLEEEKRLLAEADRRVQQNAEEFEPPPRLNRPLPDNFPETDD